MSTQELVEEGRALAFRTTVDVIYAAAVGMSHLTAIRNHAAIFADSLFPAHRKHNVCCLCGAPMIRVRGKLPNVDWTRCVKGDSFVGVPVEES